MLPLTHPLIAAAVEPLADNAEQQLAATAILSETADPNHPAAAETIARIGKIRARRHPALRSSIIGLAAALAIGAAVAVQFREFAAISGLYNLAGSFWDEPPPLPSRLSPQQRLILGDPRLSNLRQKELLLNSDPGNPAYYSEYVGAYWDEHGQLPPDFFATVARIAPDNSFFLYWAAGQIGGKSYERKTGPGAPSKPRFSGGVRLSPMPVERDYVILDQAKFDEALALLDRAAELPGFETYTGSMTAKRASLLPYDTLAGSAVTLAYGYATPSQVIAIRKVSDLLCARAQILSKEGDRERFISLAGKQQHFVRGFSGNPDRTLIHELVFSAIVSSSGQYFHWGADRLGLAEMAAAYEKQWLAVVADRDRRDIQTKTRTEDVLRQRGSMLSALTLGMVETQVADPPPLTADDLKPLRLADHEIASRYGITAAALILAVACLPVFLFRFHSPRQIRVPAKLFAKLLSAGDWAWIIGLGILLPLSTFLAINRLTPLGGRAYGIPAFQFLFPGIHLLAIVLNLLLAPAIVIRWRLSKRLAPYGIKCRPGMIPIAVLGVILAWGLCAFPTLEKAGLTRIGLIAMAVAPAIWLGNVMLGILLSVLGKPAGRIPRLATSAALLPAYAAAIIALCLTIPIFVAGEKRWIAKDTLFRIDPSAPDFGAYEFRVAAQKRREINAILGFEN